MDDVRTVAERLRAERRPFVVATIVRAERPTSAHAGDSALVLDDGTIVGFVGGECAEASVQAHALSALRDGEPLLLRISPDATADGDDSQPGVVAVHNPCLSGGSLEIFLEPQAPPGVIVVHGDAPIAAAVRELAEWLGHDARPWDGPEAIDGDVIAVIVASHGGDERTVLEAALLRGVPYIGLVASPRRARAVLASLTVDEEQRQQISTPAGLDIGSRTPPEVALSILAEVVARRPRGVPADRSDLADEAAGEERAPLATDPVCGMTVAAVDATRHTDHDSQRYWFCGPGCEQAFLADPAAYPGGMAQSPMG